MANYRPIWTKIWKDPDFEEYTPDEKLLFIYLCTNEMTTDSGIYPITPKTISNETCLDKQTVVQRLANGCIRNILYDQQLKYVFVVNFREYNAGGRPDLLEKAIANDFKKSNTTFLWNNFIEKYPQYKKAILTVGKPLANGCSTVATNPSPNPSPNPRKDKQLSAGKKSAVFLKSKTKHFEKKIPAYLDDIKSACEKIETLPKKNGAKFNPYQFVQKSVNDSLHPQAILDILKSLYKNWSGVKKPWPYVSSSVKSVSQNYNEQDHIAQSKQFKEVISTETVQAMFMGKSI